MDRLVQLVPVVLVAHRPRFGLALVYPTAQNTVPFHAIAVGVLVDRNAVVKLEVPLVHETPLSVDAAALPEPQTTTIRPVAGFAATPPGLYGEVIAVASAGLLVHVIPSGDVAQTLVPTAQNTVPFQAIPLMKTLPPTALAKLGSLVQSVPATPVGLVGSAGVVVCNLFASINYFLLWRHITHHPHSKAVWL